MADPPVRPPEPPAEPNTGPTRSPIGRIVKVVITAGVVTFLALQLVPYGWKHSNPPVQSEPPWPDAQTEQLARGACYDCHSNETEWPVYSYIAPVSWLVRSDVDEGRHEMN